MTAIDANLLLYAYSTAAPAHASARAFLTNLGPRDDVALSEFTLAEFYLHLRNPAVLDRPLDAPAAAAIVQEYRRHPRWRILGFPSDSLAVHETLWTHAARPNFARRRLFDARTAVSLRQHGVTEFATANVKDFGDYGFARVWNPLVES